MNIDDKLITLSNGRKYIVLESLEYEGKQYAYLSNKDNEIDSMIVELQNEKGFHVKRLGPEELQENILALFLEKFSKYED